MQSPIDLHICTKDIKGETYNIPLERPKIQMFYGATRAELRQVCDSDGCVLEIKPNGTESAVAPGMNMLTVPGVGSYSLESCTVRIPSEHTVHHNQYPVEVQCLHTMEGTEGRRKGMVSTLYEITDNPCPFVSELIDNMPTDMPSGPVPGTSVPFGFTPTGTAGLSRYHSYKGSRTVGDCREDVDWYVMYDPTSISKVQYVQLFGTMGDAGWKRPRPLQPLFGRHPDGCHHHAVEAGAASPICMSFLSLALAVFSLVFSS
jgi:carbonic anhydrase